MSIAIATKGRLWPIGGLVIREQFTEINLEIGDPQAVSSVVSDTSEVRLEMMSDDITAVVTTSEETESVVDDPESVTGVKGEC
jgi:molybdopterin-binding protein